MVDREYLGRVGNFLKSYPFLRAPRCTRNVALKPENFLDLTSEIKWKIVWNNIIQASKNPNHQTIHLNIVHRAYFTPRLRHSMKLESSPLCQLCTQGCLGTFTHMFWECPGVQLFWLQVTKSLSKILNKEVPCCPVLCLLNDNSRLLLSIHEKRIWLSGLTAAKKILVVRWKPPHTLSLDHWWHLLIDILILELSVARSHGAKEKTLKSWSEAITAVKSCL